MSSNPAWRAVAVPGDDVMAAFFALTDAINMAEAGTEEYRRAVSKRDGFLDAVEIYCPDIPGYFCLRGHMLMAADNYYMAQGYDGYLCGGVKHG